MTAGADGIPDRVVSCPGCGGDSIYGPRNPYRPFCSERCRNLDLGAWASESFRVPTQTDQQGGGFEEQDLQ